MSFVSKQSSRHFQGKRYLLGLLLFTVLFLGASCGKEDAVPPAKVKLTIWRSEDGENALGKAIDEYRAQYPYVSFDVRVFKSEEYEEALFNAWSKGEGPDIFSVPNWRLGKFKEFIAPMPKKSVKLKTVRTEKSLGKTKTIIEKNTVGFATPEQLRDQFVSTVTDDVVFGNTIYGLPLSVDTLVMYYNRDLLARSQVAVPPTTWEEFVNVTQAMVSLDTEKNIVRPAAALGTAQNIPHFFDIASLIMQQNGAQMVNSTGRVTFHVGGEGGGAAPGVQALDFYTAFSNPTKRTYTWNDEQLNALEAFTQGDLGFYFGYYADLEKIRERAPNLNFSYTKVPQVDLENPVNYASYSVETVHVSTDSVEHAWNFLGFATSQSQAKEFLDRTKRIPALKPLVGEKQEDTEIGVFAQQALTAKTWYHGHEPDAAVEAFQEMIDEINQRIKPIQQIMEIGAAKIRLTIE